MKEVILTEKQTVVLHFISKNDILKSGFYFTGGTALAELYLHHRLSEDLDFFSSDLIAGEILIAEIGKLKKIFKNLKISYLKDKNRQRFILKFTDKSNLKLEFVYFPFGSIRSKRINKKFGTKIDSLKSIGENKILALYETAEPKHAFDLYWISKKDPQLNLKRLFSGAKKKFGVEIDKIVFLEKAIEAADKIDKIQPLFFPQFKLSKDKLLQYFQKQINMHQTSFD